MNDKYAPDFGYAIFEREARMNALPNKVIMGPYRTETLAEEAKLRYGFTFNHYVSKIAPDRVSPMELK